MITEPTSLSSKRYRWRVCDTHLTSGSPEAQYQRQKIIQNTVRVASSMYTMNLGALSSYQHPVKEYAWVSWNQMSDRAAPHEQKNITASGSTYGGNSRKHSLLRLRPGAMSPGGKGVDIKHNSYDRHLNRLKGRAVLRRGVVPLSFGSRIAFDPAHPVYGAKTVKTAIVAGCSCPSGPEESKRIYINPVQEEIYQVVYVYSPGQQVYVIPNGASLGTGLLVGTVLSVVASQSYQVLLENGNVGVYSYMELYPYSLPPARDIMEPSGPFANVLDLISSNGCSCPDTSIVQNVIQDDINQIIGNQ